MKIDRFDGPTARPADNSWNATNLVGLPAGLIASAGFNDSPRALAIAGVRESHAALFRLLEAAGGLAEAALTFRDYMHQSFNLRPGAADHGRTAKHRFRTGYLKVLSGWGFDSNSPQGAVLKGWVESRFGLVPGYHNGPLAHYPSPAWVRYQQEKFSGRFHNNNINLQLDLLYEYCQWAIRRFVLPEGAWLTLWRGINGHGEQSVLDGSLHSGCCLLRLNNLVSFSTSRDRADEFGDWIVEATVPVVKILFFPGLLGRNHLNGENEVLVLGGDFRTKVSCV